MRDKKALDNDKSYVGGVRKSASTVPVRRFGSDRNMEEVSVKRLKMESSLLWDGRKVNLVNCVLYR
jgi:hypothetical protein